ncbi:MAG: ATP-binding cassette domain-containing protein [Candidatus Aenigmatarchaeota archaeon]
MEMLKVENLSAKIENKIILENISFELKDREILAIMGPNGSGKSTLARCIVNDKRIEKSGKIIFLGKDITNLESNEIAKLGVYLSLQFQPEIEYIKTKTFLEYLGIKNFDEVIRIAKDIGLPNDFLERGINEKFSGGERKRFEILLIKLLNPKLIIFDEIDSGLDLNFLDYLNDFLKEEIKNGKSFIIISHYTRIFREIKPDRVIVLKEGKIYKQGNGNLISLIEKHGYNI